MSNFDNTRIICGNSHQKLCEEVSLLTGIKQINCELQYFSNGEIRPIIPESVREKDIFLVQTGTFTRIKSKRSVNDHLMELFLLARTCKRSDARSITLIMPSYPYARQDKKDNPRGCISARDIADLIEFSGIKRIICFDLHCAQIQGFFNIPCDNLYVHRLIREHLIKNIFKQDENIQDKYIIVSPDEGALKKANSFAESFKLPLLVLSKDRDYTKLNQISGMKIIGDTRVIKNKTAIIIDDMCDTFGTIKKASENLAEYGVKNVILCITHGIFSGPAIERMNSSKYISHIICSDTIPQHENIKLCPKIQVYSIAKTVSQIVKRIVNGESISTLFD
jgi:ribose-phosphate pyrophosphokinase